MKPTIVTNNDKKPQGKPSREEAERAVETLLRWAGENPAREGLRETPSRVIRAYEEFFAGYEMDPFAELSKTFDDITGFDDMVIVRDIDFVSHCEHHMVPIIGKAHVAYWPTDHVVGISKLARVVDIFAKRLVSQENMTRQIVETLDKALKAKGSAVMIEADHQCMSIRGVHKKASATVTCMFTGIFKDNPAAQQRFVNFVSKNQG